MLFCQLLKLFKKLLTFHRIYSSILLEFIGKDVNNMDYERIILELLNRIQVLEEKVAILMECNTQPEKSGVKTSDICEYINKLKEASKSQGKQSIILIARDIHRELKLKSRFPMVCNAMRQCMNDNDVIIFQPPKGNSSTLEIEYKL